MVIGIRADGNSKIGMGHLMRCLSIAQALKEEEMKVLFFTAAQESAAVILERGFACEVTGVPYDRMEEELPFLCDALRKNGVNLLLTDSYQVTERYMAALNEICPVFYLDDTGEKIYPSFGLINYNIYGDLLPYRKRVSEKTKLLLGSKYAPVRAEFRNTPYEVRDRVKTILITMGGSDALNISGALCGKLLQVLSETVEIKVICGRFNPHLSSLQNMAEAANRDVRRIDVLVDVKDMWNHFAEADLCISAAGSTMYELATMGVPTVCCYYVENQRQIAEGFAVKTPVVNAGDYSADGPAVLDTILREIAALTGDREKRYALSEAMKQVTDGKGAFYLASALKKYMEEKDE